MLRSLLTLTLAAMQLLSWSGGAVYLCVGCDGTYGLDFGPHCCRCEASSSEGHVKCCHPADSSSFHPKHSCHHQHAPEQMAATADVAGGHVSVAGHCGCVHIPLSVPSKDANRIREVRQSLQEMDFVALDLSFCHSGSLTDISDQLSWTECVQLPPSSSNLAALATKFLRC